MEIGSDTEPLRPDYRALARAVNAPMRRWWKRAGWWWLLLPAVAMGCRVAVLLNPLPQNTSIFMASGGYKALALASHMLLLTTWGALLLLWLAAAQQAVRAFAAIITEANTPAGDWQARFMFTCGVRQGAWPVLAVSVYFLAHLFLVQSIRHLPNLRFIPPGPTSLLHLGNELIPTLVSFSVAGLWLSALSVTFRRNPALPWLIGIPLFILPLPVNFFVNAINNSSLASVLSHPGRPSFGSQLLSGPSIVFYAGALALMTVVWGFHNRRMIAAWSGYAVILAAALFTALSSLQFLGNRGMMILDPANIWVLISSELRSATTFIRFFPVAIGLSSYGTEVRDLSLFLPHHRVRIPVEYLWLSEAGMVVGNLAWLVLIYWLIQGVLLRRWRRPATVPTPVQEPGDRP